MVHEQTVRRNFVGTLCDVRATLRIYGENFGRQGRHLVKFINFAGVEKIGTILNSTHTFAEVILEAGFHSTSIVVFSVGLASVSSIDHRRLMKLFTTSHVWI